MLWNSLCTKNFPRQLETVSPKTVRNTDLSLVIHSAESCGKLESRGKRFCEWPLRDLSLLLLCRFVLHTVIEVINSKSPFGHKGVRQHFLSGKSGSAKCQILLTAVDIYV